MRVKLLTYNVHNGFFATDDYTNTFTRMVRWLAEQNADVVCFQEVTWRKVSQVEFNAAMRELGYPHIYYGFADDLYNNGFYGQVTVSRKAFDFVQPLAINDKGREGRCALFTGWHNGLTIVNLHLEVDDHDGSQRLRAIERMDKELNEHNSFPALVCGDFNEQTPGEYGAHGTSSQYPNLALQQVAEWGARDVFDILGKHPGRTHLAAPVRIDYIFAFDPYHALRVVSAHKPIVDFSDHYPLIAEVDVSGSKHKPSSTKPKHKTSTSSTKPKHKTSSTKPKHKTSSTKPKHKTSSTKPKHKTSSTKPKHKTSSTKSKIKTKSWITGPRGGQYKLVNGRKVYRKH